MGRSMTAYDPKKAAEYHDEIPARVPSEAALRVKAPESLLVDVESLISTPCRRSIWWR